jgi:hypothetical protein
MTTPCTDVVLPPRRDSGGSTTTISRAVARPTFRRFARGRSAGDFVNRRHRRRFDVRSPGGLSRCLCHANPPGRAASLVACFTPRGVAVLPRFRPATRLPVASRWASGGMSGIPAFGLGYPRPDGDGSEVPLGFGWTGSAQAPAARPPRPIAPHAPPITAIRDHLPAGREHLVSIRTVATVGLEGSTFVLTDLSPDGRLLAFVRGNPAGPSTASPFQSHISSSRTRCQGTPHGQFARAIRDCQPTPRRHDRGNRWRFDWRNAVDF